MNKRTILKEALIALVGSYALALSFLVFKFGSIGTSAVAKANFIIFISIVSPFWAMPINIVVALAVIAFFLALAAQIWTVRAPFLRYSLAVTFLCWLTFGLWCLVLVSGGA